MLSRAVVIALAFFVLAACETAVTERRFPEITFTHLPPIKLDVAKIVFEVRYNPTANTADIGQDFPTPPVVAAKRWIKDRLVAAGKSGVATITIRRATATENRLKVQTGLAGALTTDQAWRYDGHIEMAIRAVNLSRQRSATASATAWQSQTVPEDATLDEREAVWFGLVEKMMKNFDTAFERQIRKDLVWFIK